MPQPPAELPPPETADEMPPKGLRRYPWHQWLKEGPAIKLRRGVHYRCLDSSFASLARDMGRRRGLSVEASCSSEHGHVWVKTLGKLSADESAS